MMRYCLKKKPINYKALRKPKESKDENGNTIRSQTFYNDNCSVSVNPDTGIIIHCNPR